jgi:D-3-phosphoglycerate dehydrogenase / 2-oxoglutarate reductase
VGYENVAVDACRAKGIAVTYLPGMNAKTVAELCVALSLSTLRRVNELDRRAKRGETLIPSQVLASSLENKVVGLIGSGNVAREFALVSLSAFLGIPTS